MREDYVPNEKYRNMFGVERNGYGCERVDLYLAQLEVAFKKIREDNRSLKRELADQAAAAAQGNFSLMPQPDPESAHRLAEQQEYILRLQAQLGEAQEQNRLLAAQLGGQNEGMAMSQAISQQQAAALIAQISALRGEADELRQQLRMQSPMVPEARDEDKQSLIGRVLIAAQAQAEETLRNAQQEAEAATRKAQQQVDEQQAELQRLQGERQRVYSQMQGAYYALRNVLKDREQE